MIISSINQFCHKHGRIAGAFILLVMAIPFVFYGYFQGKDQPQGMELPESVGTVFGEDVAYQDMAMRYFSMTRQQLGANPERERWFLNYMMETEAVVQEAKNEGYGEVTKEEIIAELAKNPRFATDGKFDFAKYDALPEFVKVVTEKQTTDQIIQKRLSTRIEEEAAAKVTDQQIRDEYNKQNVTYSLQAVTYKNKDFVKSVKATDEEIAKYYEDNKEDFRIPEKKVVSYVKFTGKDVEDQLNITDQKLKAEFEGNEEKYIEVKASHILVKVDEKATEEEKAAKKKEIEEIAAKVKAGEKFEDLAKAKSACPSSSKGGDLGWFKKSAMVKPFAEKAFSMKKGEVSDIVETVHGFHIIRLVDEHKTLESVKSRVSAAVRVAELPKLSGRSADAFANAVYAEMEAPKNKDKAAMDIFTAIAKAQNKTVATTEPFENNATAVKGISSRKFGTDMKDVTEATPLSEAVAGNGSDYYVACFSKLIESNVKEFKDVDASVKTNITNKIKDKKAKEMAKKRADKALADAKRAVEGGKKFEEVSKALKFVDIKDFKAKEVPTGLAANVDVKSQLEDKKVTDFFGPVEGSTGYDVVYVKAITQATDEQFAKDKDQITETVKNGAKSDAWMAKRKDIIERANITLIEPWAEKEVVPETAE